jgi:hypothetical protein
MYSHRRQNLIGRAGGLGGLARRRLLQGAGALGLAATLRPTAVFAECEGGNDGSVGLDAGPRQSTSAGSAGGPIAQLP